MLYTLKSQVDRRAFPGNRALASWSEHLFVLDVTATYGRRVMLPVIKEKLKARRKPTYPRASAMAACTDDGGIERCRVRNRIMRNIYELRFCFVLARKISLINIEIKAFFYPQQLYCEKYR